MKPILILGDSLGAQPEYGYPIMVEEALRKSGLSYSVINSSVPGSNILGHLDRACEILPKTEGFSVTIVQVGINDSKILVGETEPLVELEWFKSKLGTLCQKLKQKSDRVLLLGLPSLEFEKINSSNLSRDYWSWEADLYKSYDTALKQTAELYGCGFVPLWDKFENKDLFNQDGVHPNADGQALICSEIVSAILDSSPK